MDIEFLDCSWPINYEPFEDMIDRVTEEYRQHVEDGYSPVYFDLFSSMKSGFDDLFDFILKFTPPYKFQEIIDDTYNLGVLWDSIYIQKVITHAKENRYPVPIIPNGLEKRLKRRNRILNKLR